jgi:putative tryptophan/tyrosine transport system substrate-binding protein
MRRRKFITLLGGAAIIWPSPGGAQQQAVPKVGYVWIGAPGTDGDTLPGLRRGLEDKGYTLGRNLHLEERYADGNEERLPALVAELLALHVDVLVTPGTQVARVAQRATSKVPIVMLSGDPVDTGLVASLARPGGNITGLSLLSVEYSAKWLQLLKEAAPKLQHVGVLWNPDNPGIVREVEQMRRVAPALGLELTTLSARPRDLEVSLAAIAATRLDGLVVSDDPFLDSKLSVLIAFTAKHSLPAIYGWGDAAKQGGLMSYSANIFELWRQAAAYVVRILKGARPADLPIEQATSFALKINLKTAKALGLTISPSLLAGADEVIE